MLLYQQRLFLINIIVALFLSSLLPLLVVIECYRCEKYKYIIEELFIEEDKIIIFHNNKKERIEKYKIKFDEIVDLEYKDGFFLNPYRPDTFLEEKEARKIMKTIKESKENYEKFQKEIKEFQKNKKILK